MSATAVPAIFRTGAIHEGDLPAPAVLPPGEDLDKQNGLIPSMTHECPLKCSHFAAQRAYCTLQ